MSFSLPLEMLVNFTSLIQQSPCSPRQLLAMLFEKNRGKEKYAEKVTITMCGVNAELRFYYIYQLNHSYEVIPNTVERNKTRTVLIIK